MYQSVVPNLLVGLKHSVVLLKIHRTSRCFSNCIEKFYFDVQYLDIHRYISHYQIKSYCKFPVYFIRKK